MMTRSDNEFPHYVVARLKDLWILIQQQQKNHKNEIYEMFLLVKAK